MALTFSGSDARTAVQSAAAASNLSWRACNGVRKKTRQADGRNKKTLGSGVRTAAVTRGLRHAARQRGVQPRLPLY